LVMEGCYYYWFRVATMYIWRSVDCLQLVSWCLCFILLADKDANADDAAASVPMTNVAAVKIAINPRVVWFILYFVRY
jgi:hypothetical protein